jgi:hypothetical protein
MKDSLLPALVGAGFLSRDFIDSFRKKHKLDPKGDQTLRMITSMGLISDQLVAKAISEIHGLPLVKLHPRFLEPELEALNLLPSEIARFFFCIPYRCNETSVTVAMTDAPDPTIVYYLSEFVGKFEVSISTHDDIRLALDRYYPQIKRSSIPKKRKR